VMTKHLRIGVLTFVAAAVWAPRVYAQKVDATVQVDARSISGDKDQPPDLVARVISGSAPPAMDKIVLVETGTGPKKNIDIEIPATDVKTYVQGDEALGVAVVFETDWLWLGNESWCPKEASRTEGYYKPLTAALDKLNVAGPPGSKAALVAYGAGSNVKWQGDLKDLTGDKIGTERELTLSTIKVEPTQDNPEGLSGVQQLDVAAGVDDAIGALNKMGVSRKVLIIIGDGNHADTLADYKKKLQSDDITCYAIGIASLIPDQLPGDEGGWKKIAGPNAKWITAPEEIGNKIGGIVDGLADRYYVRFPGADVKLKKSFTWDEQPHDFVLRGVAPKDYELPDQINLTPAWVPPWMRHAKKSIWSWLRIPFAAVGGLIFLVIVAKVIGGRKKAPEPMPVPIAAPAPGRNTR